MKLDHTGVKKECVSSLGLATECTSFWDACNVKT